MIVSLEGRIEDINNNCVELVVAGLGYEVWIPTSVLVNVSVGDNRKFYTYHMIREDDEKLFGFESRNDLEIFNLLISVNGVGPKAGLAILSTYNCDQICEAVLREDERLFASVSGIGKKGAAKIVLELKGKVSGIAKSVISDNVKTVVNNSQNDLIDAMVSLGYNEREVYQKIVEVDQSAGLNDQIKEMLKLLAKS